MKTKLAVILILLSLISIAACCEPCGNLNNGGFALSSGENLYIADKDGLWLIEGRNAPRLIEEGSISMLQMYSGRLYYIKNLYEEDENGFTSLSKQTPVSCLPDGSDKKPVGESRNVGSRLDYSGENGKIMELDSYIGYQCFTVYNDWIYYLSNSEIAGEYVCSAAFGEDPDDTIEVTGKYASGIALFRSGLNGEDTQRLTDVVGNSIACMAIENDKIYLAAGYQDTVYAYNYVNYSVLSLTGEVLSVFENTFKDPESTLKSDAGEFYHITNAVIPYKDSMLISLSDSEGDFVASQLFKLDPDGTQTRIAIEQHYVPSVLVNGLIYYVGSASTTNFHDDSVNYADSFGIYRKGADEDGPGIRLCPVRYDGFAFNLKICVTGEYVYFKGETGEVFRSHTETSATEKFKETGFVKASSIER